MFLFLGVCGIKLGFLDSRLCHDFCSSLTPYVDLKSESIQAQLISYQCQHRHNLLIDQCQTNGHDLGTYVSMRTSYKCQQGHKLSTINATPMGTILNLFVSFFLFSCFLFPVSFIISLSYSLFVN